MLRTGISEEMRKPLRNKVLKRKVVVQNEWGFVRAACGSWVRIEQVQSRLYREGRLQVNAKSTSAGSRS
jgi:hypothetical protein